MPEILTLSDYESVVRFAVNTKLPDWQKEYMCKIAEGLQVHTRGFLFQKVNTLYPNEHPSSQQHCLDAYEPITKASIWTGINNINRIFINSSFVVNTGEKSLSYIEEHRFDSKNLFSWFVDEWIKWAIADDPNSLMVVYPLEYAEQNQFNPIKFIPYCYRLHLDRDLCIFVSEEESEKTYSYDGNAYSSRVFYDKDLGGPNTSSVVKRSYNSRLQVNITRKVYHVFTRDYFMRIVERDGDSYDYEVLPFGKTLPELPCYISGGLEIERGIYDTFVSPFIPYGNLALIQHRQHTAVNLVFSFPRISEIETPCGDCTLGYVKTVVCEEFPDGRMPCKTCKGTGFTTNHTPYKTYRRRVDPNNFEDAKLADIEDVKYYTPDVAILQYSKDEWYNYLRMGEESIFIQQKKFSGDAESAKSKEIDRDQQYAWLTKISRMLFDKIRSAVQSIENYSSPNPTKVTVEQPFSFAILTENEAFEALNEIINSKAPNFLKAQQVDNFTGKFVSKNSPVIKAVNILKQVDPFLYYSNDEMQGFRSSNVLSSEQYRKHVLSYPILMQMYSKDRTLFDNEPETVAKLLENEIEKQDKPEEDMRKRLLKKVSQEDDDESEE